MFRLRTSGHNAAKVVKAYNVQFLFMNILGPKIERPAQMSRSQYTRFRVKLLTILIALIGGAAAVVLHWEQLPLLVKAVLAIAGWIIIPTVDMIEQIFVPYEKYLKEGL